MNMPVVYCKKPLAAALTALLLVACSTSPAKPDGAENVRGKLTQLQSDPQLASRAPVAIQEAEVAVRAAEEPQEKKRTGEHLVLMADRKVDIAIAQAQARLAEDQRKQLGEQRDAARLDARTLEADKARLDANSARTDANIARSQADLARTDANAAQQESEDLQRQLAELNARPSDRGLVVTLGDVLFETGKSGLKGGATSNLAKLAGFLKRRADRTVIIEGHTDSVGSEASNVALSQRRADAVKSYLINQGVDSDRINASGKGEVSPVAVNDSATGRQQNRRVEVIISNAATASMK